ncbi:unnamed protein product [Notodromas monacha]|uniref:sphinganine-1-phosphate aldolase n=1 Tax=Notodromas monacha TaxID=399045 RepID=A0A7R9BZ75_9CRUS|nr:unnamed protein product [Notodromas monacha]CAG0922827.1 unnamed protein product [Notodromas monacha]
MDSAAKEKIASVALTVAQPVLFINSAIDRLYSSDETWWLILKACGLTYVTVRIYDQLQPFDDPKNRLVKYVGKLMTRLPAAQKKIRSEMNAIGEALEKDFYEKVKEVEYSERKMPRVASSAEVVLRKIDDHVNLGKISWRTGRASGAVYFGNEELYSMQSQALLKTAIFNPLHPEIFPAVRKFEAEIVAWTCSLFNAPPESCGVISSGGTESIFIACLAYRNWAVEKGIQVPEMVVADSAHAAFEKAALVMRMRIRKVPCCPITFKVDVGAMTRAINKNTCMLVASAPSFPHGVIEPVETIAGLGLKYGIPVHVDACLGGFLLAFMNDAGYPIPPFDFRVPGVTSLSADTHKYGYAMKGTSVILFKEPKWRDSYLTSFAITDWPGGLYITTTLAGSRPGGLITACWAAINYVGYDGYVERTKKIISTTRHIQSKLEEIEGLQTLKPEVSVISMRSDEFCIYTFMDAMAKRGWNLNPLQFPQAIHLCVTLLQTEEGVADAFIADCKAVAAEMARTPGEVSGSGRMYGASQALPIRSIVGDSLKVYVDKYYSTRRFEN